jgi:PiT family inorganic phosphate transporter
LALFATHVVAGSVLGPGLGRRLAEVRWLVAGQMALAWLLTLPAVAGVGALDAAVVIHRMLGVVVIGVVALVVTVAIYAIARCGLVAARNVND